MKKKWIIPLILCAVLFVPFRKLNCNDGGTMIITSLTYTVVKWKRVQSHRMEDGSYKTEEYENTCVYFFPDNFKDYDELWEIRH